MLVLLSPQLGNAAISLDEGFASID